MAPSATYVDSVDQIGLMAATDTGTATYPGFANFGDTLTTVRPFGIVTSAANGTMLSITSTAPFTWGTTDCAGRLGNLRGRMRFRTSGKNWESRQWVLAPCLVELAEQVDALHPTPHPTDGTVAGKAHDKANPSSDHRPFPWSAKTGAVVRALDAGETVENDAFAIAEAIRLSRDPRIKYVLHESRMYSSYPSGIYKPYTWRPYSGPPHDSHVHFSTLAAFDNDTRPWTIKQGGGDMPWTKPGDEVENVADARAVNAYQGWGFWKQADFDYDENDPAQLDERFKVISARLIDWMMRNG